MAELKTFDFTGALGRGLQLGQGIRQQQNQGKLAALLGQARTTSGPQRDALMGQVYGLDPASGMAADQGLGKLDEIKAKRLGQMASIFTSMAPEQRAQAWPTIRQELSQIIPGAQYPEMWDESLLPQAQAIAQQLSGAGSDAPAGFAAVDMAARAAGFQPGTPEYQKVMRIHTGFEPGYAKTSPRSITTDINGVPTTLNYDPTTGGYMPAVIGGVTPQQVQAAFQTIGERNGFEITSMQRPVMPGIGAGVNSQHPHGTAVDYRTRGKSPEQIEALKRDLAAAGFEVIDESDGRSGTGPHIHAELPKGMGAQGGTPIVGRRKEDEAYATEAAKRRAELEAAPAMQAVETQGAIDQMQAESAIKPTKAQEAVDTQYGKEYVEFMQGGAADANKALSELSGVIEQLDSGENLTGPGLGLLPKFVKERVAARAQDAQETVESTVQRSLRVILGAQFTEKEGERLIARAYNPSLPEEVNRVRVQRLFQQLKEGFENKAAAARYYEQNGTLRGFTGKLPSWGDFNPDGGAPQQNRSAASAPRRARNPQTGEILELRNGQWVPAQ